MIADESFLASGGCPAGSAAASRNDPANAHIRALSAVSDERFCRAWDEYQLAHDKLNEIRDADLKTVAQVKTKKLIQVDVEYRQLLLERNIGFWGGARTLIPSIPVIHLRQMHSLLADFEKVASEIETSTSRIEDVELKGTQTRAVAEGAVGQAEAQRITGEKQEMLLAAAGAKEKQSQEQAVALEAYRQSLDKIVEQLKSENSSIQAGLNKAIVNAVASSAGVPVGALDAAQHGNLAGVVMAVAEQPQFSSVATDALKQVSGGSTVLVDAYNKANEIKGQVENAAHAADQIRAFVRAPSAEGLSALGESLYSSPLLGSQDRANIRAAIDAAKPVLSATHLLQNIASGASAASICKDINESPELRSTLGSSGAAACGVLTVDLPGLCDPSMPLPAQLQNLGVPAAQLNKVKSQVAGACEIKATLAAGIAGDNDARQKLLGQLAKISETVAPQGAHLLGEVLRNAKDFKLSGDEWKHLVVVQLQVSAQSTLTSLLSVPDAATARKIKAALLAQLHAPADMDDATLARMLADHAAGGIPGVEIRGGALRVLDPSGKEIASVDGAAFLKSGAYAFSKSEIALSAGQATTMLTSLTQNTGSLTASVLRSLPSSQLEEVTQRVLQGRPKFQDSMWRALQTKTSATTAESIERYAIDVSIGAQVTAGKLQGGKLPDPPAPAPKVSETAPPPPDGGPQPDQKGPDVTQAAALLALNAAFPGAGVAVQVLQGMATMSANNQRINDIEAEQIRIVEQIVQLHDMARDEVFQQELTKKELELAKALSEAAAEQVATYNFAIMQTAEMAGRQRARMAARRPLIFYVAERLRQEYEAFDRAMALWSGYQSTPGKAIERMIRSDPQNVRLALDTEIHLYDWLNRDRESTRSDVDGLLMHWRQLLRLCDDLCETRGCQPGDGRLGQLQQTPAYRLSSLVDSATWHEFKAWQASKRNAPFPIAFLVHPALPSFPPAYSALRVVDTRLSGIDEKGQTVRLTGVSLRHPGFSLVPTRSEDDMQIEFEHESMLPREAVAFEPADPFNLEELRLRWSTGLDQSPRMFEGYGFFTTWRLLFQPDEVSKSIEDVAVRFAYSYVDPELVVTEEDYMRQSSGSAPEPETPVPIFEWRACKRASLDCKDQESVSVSRLFAFALRGNRGASAIPEANDPNSFVIHRVPRTCDDIKHDLRRVAFSELFLGQPGERLGLSALDTAVVARVAGDMTKVNSALQSQNLPACTSP
jgi:hypothetical protein